MNASISGAVRREPSKCCGRMNAAISVRTSCCSAVRLSVQGSAIVAWSSSLGEQSHAVRSSNRETEAGALARFPFRLGKPQKHEEGAVESSHFLRAQGTHERPKPLSRDGGHFVDHQPARHP
jgi:hypothetical protein